MKKMAAAKFKQTCLTVMETVRQTKEPVVITKRGKPVAKLVAIDEPDDFIGSLESIGKIVGDIESPIYPLEAWEALR